MALVDEHAPHAAGHADDHHEPGFLGKYVFSQDHKVIGLQYGFTSLLFLFFGFTLMMFMRWQLAFPGRPLPLLGGCVRPDLAPGGIMLPELYNQLGAMHGTIMVFLGVVPLAVGAFGNYLVPLQIGGAGHGFPEAQHGELLDVLRRRRRDAGQLLRAGRRGAVGLDVLSAAVGHRPDGPDGLAVRHAVR